MSSGDAEAVASCEEHGVLGPIVGTVGSLAALEVIKAEVSGGLLLVRVDFNIYFHHIVDYNISAAMVKG